MGAIITHIRIFECRLMEILQKALGPFGSLCISGCHVGDPKSPHIYFPFLLAISSPETAFRVLWAVNLSEWCNICLKIMLNDHRPYWWLPEYAPKSNITLNMFDITCETSPGNPSGHVMVTLCVWLVAYWHLCENRILNQKYLTNLSMATIVTWLVIIGFGRIYISAHFPDQVFIAVIAGVLLGKFVNCNISMANLRSKHHMLLALMAVAIYQTIRYFVDTFSGDKDWSLKLALKWCGSRRYVKADSTPSFTVCRVFSSLVGIAFTFMYLHRKVYKGADNVIIPANMFKKVAIGTTGSFACYIHLNYCQPSTSFDSLEWFYARSFFLYFSNTVIGYLVVHFLNRFALKQCNCNYHSE